jgi:hypothetical protein
MARRSLAPSLLAIAVLLTGRPTEAAFHLWDIKEIYSNADGSVQYVELFTTFSNENIVGSQQIVATSDGVSRTFTFNGNLPSSSTANRHVLIATPGFAALPGAVPPDYILPCGPFFDPGAGIITIDYAGLDSVTFPGASLPTDGTNSLTDTTNGTPTTTLATGASSPTNFSGAAGGLNLTGCLQLGTCDACDDGLFCNGLESCSGSACAAGSAPCSGVCDEENDTCTLEDDIFADGFETGDLLRWDASVVDGADLAASGAAALRSTLFGLEGLVDDVSALYVQDDTPGDEGRYRARLYFDTNGFDPGETQGRLRTRLFIAFEEDPTRRVMALVLRRQGGQYSLMGRARRDDDGQSNTGFFPIADGPHFVELDWVQSASPDAENGSFQLWIDGESMITLTGLDNSRSGVDLVRMGARSVKSGASGTLYWDEFVSRRESYIGP